SHSFGYMDTKAATRRKPTGIGGCFCSLRSFLPSASFFSVGANSFLVGSHGDGIFFTGAASVALDFFFFVFLGSSSGGTLAWTSVDSHATMSPASTTRDTHRILPWGVR